MEYVFCMYMMFQNILLNVTAYRSHQANESNKKILKLETLFYLWPIKGFVLSLYASKVKEYFHTTSMSMALMISSVISPTKLKKKCKSRLLKIL